MIRLFGRNRFKELKRSVLNDFYISHIFNRVAVFIKHDAASYARRGNFFQRVPNESGIYRVREFNRLYRDIIRVKSKR